MGRRMVVATLFVLVACAFAAGSVEAAPVLKAPVKQLHELPEGALKKPPALVMPDLVIENFSVDTGGKQIHGREAWYPMTARIGNLGTRPVTEPFYIAFELIYGAQGQCLE